MVLGGVGGLGATSTAQAGVGNALGQAWNCAKSSAGAALTIPKVVVQKGEKLAAIGADASTCLAQSSADPEGFALVSGVIVAVKVASPGTLPNGQCLQSVRKGAAKPIALGIAAVLPPGSVKDGLLNAASSDTATDTLWNQMEVMPPPVSTLASHASCACKLIDGGLDLLDTSEVTSAIGSVSSSCAGFLDAAGLGFVNKYGDKTIHWSEQEWSDFTGYIDTLKGESKPAPDEFVYQWFYGSMVDNMSRRIATSGGDVGSLAVVPPPYSANYSYSTASGHAAAVNMSMMLDNCVDYYDKHTMSKSSALEVCNKWQARFPGEVATEVTRRKAITAFLIFASGAQKRLADDYAKRFPRHVLGPTSTEANHGITVWSQSDVGQLLLPLMGKATFGYDAWTFEGTGIYQSGMRILPTLGYSTQSAQKAFELAYAGQRPEIVKAIYDQWRQHAPEVRYQYLPTVLPAGGAFAGPHGCPSSPPMGDKCVSAVENLFDNFCNGPIATAWVEGGNDSSIQGKLNSALESCIARLRPYVDASNALAQDGPELNDVVQKNCQGTPRSEAQTACTKNWSDLWNSCRVQALVPPLSKARDNALACLNKGNFRVLRMDLPTGPAPTGPGGRPSAPIVPAQAPAPVTAPVGTSVTPKASAPATLPSRGAVTRPGGVTVPSPAASAASSPRAPVRIGG
jgi:hypothetical protein